MSKQRIEMNVEAREIGKSTSRALRNDRKVPAVVYGSVENKNVYIEENAVKKYNVRAYENALLNLKSSDSKLNGIVVLLKEVIVHPVTRRPQHVDLFALDLKKMVRVSIEVRLEGKPIGIADGGLLNVVNRQIEIECLPTAIPEGITADISGLGVGDALHVSDLKIPSDLKVLSPLDMTIAVLNLQEEEVIAAPVAAAATDAAAPAAGAAAAPAAGAAAAGAKAPAAAGAKAPAAAKPAAKK
jgi:large subunit ribosomal protein L25